MPTWIIVLISVLVVFAIVIISLNESEKKKSEDSTRKTTGTESVSGSETEQESAPYPGYPGRRASQKSLDMLYAESHGMWVCRCCETINDGGARICAACGKEK